MSNKMSRSSDKDDNFGLSQYSNFSLVEKRAEIDGPWKVLLFKYAHIGNISYKKAEKFLLKFLCHIIFFVYSDIDPFLCAMHVINSVKVSQFVFNFRSFKKNDPAVSQMTTNYLVKTSQKTNKPNKVHNITVQISRSESGAGKVMISTEQTKICSCRVCI